uniref:Saposin B-type domain-containing protein n=1 Tax=Rhabditophanes sp. KR3021 TaxID=114890 RepID=A0AC35U910_9BILA
MSAKFFTCILILALANTYFVNAERSEICNMCNYIIGVAEKHFTQNEPESDLMKLLTQGCYYLGNSGGGQIVGPCLDLIHKNIDTLYSDFQSGMNAWTLCNQQKLCTAADTNPNLLL